MSVGGWLLRQRGWRLALSLWYMFFPILLALEVFGFFAGGGYAHHRLDVSALLRGGGASKHNGPGPSYWIARIAYSARAVSATPKAPDASQNAPPPSLRSLLIRECSSGLADRAWDR